MKVIRNYLKGEEIDFIVNEMKTKESFIEREIVKVGIVAQVLIDDIGEYNDCIDIYNVIVASDIDFEKEVKNYSLIDKIIDKEFGTAKIVENFLIELEHKLDEMNNEVSKTNLEGLVKQLKEVNTNAIKTV